MPWCMSRCLLEPDLVRERVIVGDDISLAGLDHREHAVVDATIGVLGAFLVEFRPETEFRFGENVARVWEGRNPAAIDQFRIPADMIGVQMGTHNKIDIVDRQPDGGQSVEVFLARQP